MDNNDKNNQPKKDGNRNRQSILMFLICVLISLVCMGAFSDLFSSTASKEISYDKFISMVDAGQVKEVQLEGSTITIVPKKSSDSAQSITYYTTMLEDTNELTKRLEDTGIEFYRIPEDPMDSIISAIIGFLVPFILLLLIFSVFMRQMNKGGGVMGVGKSKAKAYVQQETGVTFKDVAGQDEAKVIK